MAKNIQSLQLLRNTSVLYENRDAALTKLTGGTITTQDGTPVLARYKGTDGKIYTLVGYYADSSAFTGGDSAASHMTVFDIEGSTADVKELENMIGTGVTTTDTVTKQLQNLSGTTDDTSATTSVVGAKKYAEAKVTEAVNGLNATITADTGYYINKVDEVNGKISGTTAALPTVDAIGEAGKPITAVSENLGAVSAATGTINAGYVNVTGSVFTSSTVQAALEEIDTEYKAADAAIVNNASESANTLAKLEGIVNNLSTNAKEYSIKKITGALSTNVKEAWGLFDADNNQSGATINIYKDSAYKEIYLGTADDTIDTTNGTITKKEGEKQSLNYAYMKADGTYDLVKVDVSAFLSENEFKSGVTVTNHIVHGVVDSTSEKDSQETQVDFLTVGENGFKVSGIKDEINRKINALDASVTGGTTAGTETNGHIRVVVDEVDGKLTAVTVSEANIADANKLADLSGKTVTEVASSNDSITATPSAAADGTKHLDIITDASKIKMTGFINANALSGITESSSVTQALLKVDNVITEKAEVISAALNDLEATKAEKTALDDEIAARKAVDGQNGDTYSANTSANYISGATTLNDADIKLDAALKALDYDVIKSVKVNNVALGKTSNAVNVQISSKPASGTSASPIIVNTDDTTGAVTLQILQIDCGEY